MKSYAILGFADQQRVTRIVQSLDTFHNGEPFQIVTLGREGMETDLINLAPTIGNCIVEAIQPPTEPVYREESLAARLMQKANTGLVNQYARTFKKPWDYDLAVNDSRIQDEVEEFHQESINHERRFGEISPWQLQQEAVAHEANEVIVLTQDKTSMKIARMAAKLGRKVHYL